METKSDSKVSPVNKGKVTRTPAQQDTGILDFGESTELGLHSPESILNIQRTLGNQATLRLLNQGGIPLQAGIPSNPDGVLQRLPTADDIQGAVDKDIKTQKAKQKAQEKKAKKSKQADESKSEEKEESKSFFDSVTESISELVETVVKAVGDIIDKAVFENLLTKLNEFHTYDAHFKSLDPAYSDHMERLQHIKSVEVASAMFMSTHKEGDPGFKRVVKLKKESVDAYIKASPNADRAKQARRELKKKKTADTNSPARITDDLIETMVMSVASPMNESDDKGSAGILGIQSAIDAADALMMVRQEDYDKIMGILSQSGDNLGEVAKQATLIKALAARKTDLLAAGPQTAEAMQELDEFAAEIKDMDKDEMVSKTHASDRGSGQGLQQRFTMSCGPTSIMIVKGDFDPVYALKLSKEGKHGLAFDGDIADEQKGLLEGTNGVDTAVPREVEDDWNTTVAAVNTFMSSATNAQKSNLRNYFRELAGTAFNATKAAAGKTLTKTIVPAIAIDTRDAEWKKFYALLGNAPGWGNTTFANNAQAEMGADTKRDFSETAINYKSKLIAGKTELRGGIRKHFKPLNKALFRGQSVPLGVMWAGGGGHFMVFSDIKTEEEGGKKVKYYLVSDPWEGHSGWMSRKDLIQGKFGIIGASQGAIDSIYI